MAKDISPEQCRMARAALKWNTQDLSKKADVGLNTVNRFEGGTVPGEDIIKRIRSTFEKQGVKFTDDGCVCFQKKKKAK